MTGPPIARKPIRVLLIDDDEDELVLTRSVLKRVEDVRYELDWVGTFGEGLASIIRNDHDAYLIDQYLGYRTGIELVREARAAGSLAALIMLTGHRDRDTDLEASEAGATGFLLKGKTDPALLDRTLRYSVAQAAVASALERSRRQIAGLDEIGRTLVEDGPTPTTMGRVVDLLIDRFAIQQVSIYLADGDSLHLAGQVGYEHPVPSLRRLDAAVERVARARQPIFVPSLSPTLGHPDDGHDVACELSVPLMVAGELAGLMNVPSPVAAPIGEQGLADIRLIADRLTAALEVVHERTAADERLATARRQLLAGPQPSTQQSLIDGQTMAYRRSLLEPLLEIAIASAGGEQGQNVGLLLVACNDASPDMVSRLAEQARAVFTKHPCVRFAEAELAVLIAAADAAAVRSQAGDLVALARAAGLEVWCGYASLTAGWGASDLVAGAEAALEYARRLGPGAFVG